LPASGYSVLRWTIFYRHARLITLSSRPEASANSFFKRISLQDENQILDPETLVLLTLGIEIRTQIITQGFEIPADRATCAGVIDQGQTAWASVSSRRPARRGELERNLDLLAGRPIPGLSGSGLPTQSF